MNLTDIKLLRKKFNLTQTQLAKLSGVSQSLIAKIEADRIDPTYTKTQKIFDVLRNFGVKKEKRAADIMSTSIIRTDPHEQVIQAVKKMKKHQISQMPVYQDDTIVGIISESTILDGISQTPEKLNSLRVGDLMESVPPTVPQEAPASALLDLLKYYSILLVGSRGKIVGIITKADLLENFYN